MPITWKCDIPGHVHLTFDGAADCAATRRRAAAPSAPAAPDDTILDEAKRLAYGDRHADYGHPLDDYTRVVGAFHALTGIRLTPEQGVTFMLCVKLARLAHAHKRDSVVDLAGYADCLQRIVEERAARADRDGAKEDP
ncbi:MAG TPA: DUF6378 domain-containing protein [Gemmatimonadales bacterium]|nr:DUF6378 domain-containing protein [Gemmatimonadales bacterium]